MSFTETTRTSWFARLKNGVIGIFIGLLLVFGMIWLLAWNEGRSVKTYRALVEGAGAVVDVDIGAVEAGNEGKLVHIAGRIDPVGTPTDSLLEVSANGAAGLRRSVEMYQWVEEKKSETRKTLGGGEETVTTYSYAKEWRSDRADWPISVTATGTRTRKCCFRASASPSSARCSARFQSTAGPWPISVATAR